MDNFIRRLRPDTGSHESLGLYLSMALLTLKLWELVELALPLLALLCVQTIVLLILTYYVLFRILGKNYDAAVMSAGLIGHDLGSTPTAVANMTTIHAKYGVSRKALIIVPIIGAFLIDVFYQPYGNNTAPFISIRFSWGIQNSVSMVFSY